MIALYIGKSALSRTIRVFNWSDYSHAAWVDTDGSVYQAWKKGVTHTDNISEGHTPGTMVDMFAVEGETPGRSEDIREFMERHLGAQYDWLGILGFPLRARISRANKWFCSELVAAAYGDAALPLLLRIEPAKIYPGLLSYSPRLRHIGGTITT
jgi:hypothetical protein